MVGIGRGVRLALMIVGYVVVTPVVTYHLLNHWEQITAWLGKLVPPARRDDVLGFVREYDGQLGHFVRGTLTEGDAGGDAHGRGLALLGSQGRC